jgi:flavodoxin
MNCLVVYYSRTGTTRAVATAIADTLGADIEALTETADRHQRGLLGFLRGVRDAIKKRSSDLDVTKFNPTYYDVVILGTPVWTGSLPPAMRSYLDAYGKDLPKIATFCTTDVSGIENTLNQMAAACDAEVVATMGLKRKQVKKDQATDTINEFCQTITQAATTE